jgi:CcmD family protein
MSGIAIAFPANGYLFAAYAATWIIHIVYLGTIVSRYSRLRREIEDLKKPGVRS